MYEQARTMLIWVEVRRDLFISRHGSRHGRRFSSFALFLSYLLSGVNETA